MRVLFTVAHCLQPAVIFIDEIDSLLSARKAEGVHLSEFSQVTWPVLYRQGHRVCVPCYYMVSPDNTLGCRSLLAFWV